MKQIVFISFLFTALIGCKPTGSDFVPLSAGVSSMDSVAIRFIAALNEGDTAAIGNLVISEYEHNQLLLPEFHLHYPAATPDQADVIWENLSKKILKGSLYLIGNHMKRNYQFKSLTFEDPVEEFKTFRIHTNSLLTVLDSTGAERSFKLFGSVVERNGQYKILSYREP
ncbi:MAG: hypothetical protein HUU10_09610 [Bacteroidetes bacterium]|nr:hypothetical protein [Bacteroidota bacterium]